MPDRLTAETRHELADLAYRYGHPLRVRCRLPQRRALDHEAQAPGGGWFDPISRADRFGEVAMVIRRPKGRILLSTKDFYPAGAFRLPTGGISHGETVLGALLREAQEETGLDVTVRRFLAWIDYEDAALSEPARMEPAAAIFHTFAFLLDERGGTLGSLDPGERILSYREVAPDELDAVAERLEVVTSRPSEEIGGDWADWGAFRAVVHRAVARALASA